MSEKGARPSPSASLFAELPIPVEVDPVLYTALRPWLPTPPLIEELAEGARACAGAAGAEDVAPLPGPRLNVRGAFELVAVVGGEPAP